MSKEKLLVKESYSSENFNETTLDEIIAAEIDNMMSDDIDKDLKLFNRIKKALKQQKENEIVVLISDYFSFDIYELDENTYKVEMIKELNPATAVYKVADDLIMVQEHRNGKVFDYFANEEDADRFKAMIDNTYDFNESLEEDYNGVVIGKYIDPHKENYEDIEYSQYPNYDKIVEVIGGQTVDVKIYPVNYKEKNLGHSAYFALKTTDGGFKHHMLYIYNLKRFIDRGEIELTNGWEWSDDYPHLVKKNEN